MALSKCREGGEGSDKMINIGFESPKCIRIHTHNKHKISIFWLALTLSGKVRGLVVTTTYAQHGCSNRGKPMQYIAVQSTTSVTTAQFWALAMSSNAVHQVLNGQQNLTYSDGKKNEIIRKSKNTMGRGPCVFQCP